VPKVLGSIMGSSGFLRGLFGHHDVTANVTKDAEERRQDVVRCSGCKTWSKETVYLSNGGHYCVPCAQIVHGWSRAKPVGRRASDITALPEQEAPAQR
jgi:hypothetical protein